MKDIVVGFNSIKTHIESKAISIEKLYEIVAKKPDCKVGKLVLAFYNHSGNFTERSAKKFLEDKTIEYVFSNSTQTKNQLAYVLSKVKTYIVPVVEPAV